MLVAYHRTSVWVSAGIRDSSAGAGTGICDQGDPCGWSFGYFGYPEFWQESRRLEILKDSHAGAFAVITAAVYFIAWYGATVSCLTVQRISGRSEFEPWFMVSRCLSGI